jgi:hypothetical protein
MAKPPGVRAFLFASTRMRVEEENDINSPREEG